MKLLNKKAIITGAYRSIGRGSALEFAKEGADVVISYRSKENEALKTVESIKKMGRQAKAIHAEFSTINGVENFFNEAINFLGQVDILVNNAAAYNTKSFLDLSIDEFESMLLINVRSPMALSQLAAKDMVNKGIQGGNIVNISSISGSRPYPNRAAHASAKAALNMLTKCTGLELAPYNIRVNAIAPGPVSYEDDEEPILSALGKGVPNHQAKGAVYLASTDSEWVTGQVLTIDGGYSLKLSH